MGLPLESGDLIRRKPLRLRNYDYATPGIYFVTICAARRATVVGRAVDASID